MIEIKNINDRNDVIKDGIEILEKELLNEDIDIDGINTRIGLDYTIIKNIIDIRNNIKMKNIKSYFEYNFTLDYSEDKVTYRIGTYYKSFKINIQNTTEDIIKSIESDILKVVKNKEEFFIFIKFLDIRNLLQYEIMNINENGVMKFNSSLYIRSLINVVFPNEEIETYIDDKALTYKIILTQPQKTKLININNKSKSMMENLVYGII